MDQPIQNNTNFELTKSQLLMWMGQKLKPESPMYNMAISFDLAGQIDEVAFQSAFQLLLLECDAMRTVFIEKDGVPQQQIKSNFPYQMEVLDFSGPSNQPLDLDNWKKSRSQQIVDITACLFDSVLIKLSSDHYVWYFNQHHLITDAWAVTVQFQAMAKLYQAQLTGDTLEDWSLPKFENYLHQINESCKEASHQMAEKHWKEKMPTIPEFPIFYQQANLELQSESIRATVTIPKEKADRLRALTMEPDLRAWTQHLSLFSIFSTLLYSYIYRISGQQKLAIGAPAHNRSTAEYKETPGVFIELFPLISNIEKGETFSSLFQKVRNESFDFLKYAQPQTSTPELNRGFNVVLNYINAAFSDFNQIPTTTEWIHTDHADPGHHIRLQVHDFNASGNIDLCFDLNTAVFNSEQIAATPLYFVQLLDAFMEDRLQAIEKPALGNLTANSIVAKPNNFAFDPHASVIDLYQKSVVRSPDTTAVRYSETTLTYQELDAHVNQLANYLKDNGVVAKDRVAIYLNRSPEFVISLFAVLKLGATFVPVPVNYPSGRVLGIVEDAQPKVILSNSVLLKKIPVDFNNKIALDTESAFIQQKSQLHETQKRDSNDLAYLMYTSGSTGKPKGVMINHGALSHYIQWAADQYVAGFLPVVPLFTSIGFDLTITSLFLPFVSGGTLITYPEAEEGPDLALFKVMEDNLVNLIKLTPSHIELLRGGNYQNSLIRSMIVGGENFKTDQAKLVQTNLNDSISIFNEYGPTEATVGCLVYQYDSTKDQNKVSVPIGSPIPNVSVYILDEFQNVVPAGVSGELYISGAGLAKGYWKQAELTATQFVANPFQENSLMYRSGDLVRQHPDGPIEYLGRKDLQVKIRGRRVELAEIETVLNQHPEIKQGIVELRERRKATYTEAIHNCTVCGLPSNYPNSSLNEAGVCNLCQDFESYQQKVSKYFKTEDDLRKLFNSVPANEKGEYDCLALLSGGKDSTYVLAQLVELGLRPLAFTLDNGYISEEAKDNVRRVVTDLGVDHVFGETPAMNAIFVDSLQRHCNVCDGCFKTIYTLSTQLALEKNIPFIVTGLSRGQFFETRLTEELFRQEDVDIDKIDATILNARKAYHQADDAVKELLDTSMFEDESVFDKIQFVDYYRYTDVSLAEMLDYLDKKLSWVRPSDTGRSTNCLINQAGIYVHKKELGYSNYAFPYSWDVRIGHKTRAASLEEINEVIDEPEVKKMLQEIGYTAAQSANARHEQLVAYYVGSPAITEADLKNYLLKSFPDYMVPVQFIRLETMPLTVNGKINREALPQPDRIRPVLAIEYVAPQTEFEILIRDIWSEVMQIDQIGIHDNFINIGGDSLSGIRVVSRINEAMELDLPVNVIFQQTTIAQLAAYVEQTIRQLLEELEKTSS